jgi:hypothetical protein
LRGAGSQYRLAGTRPQVKTIPEPASRAPCFWQVRSDWIFPPVHGKPQGKSRPDKTCCCLLSPGTSGGAWQRGRGLRGVVSLFILEPVHCLWFLLARPSFNFPHVVIARAVGPWQSRQPFRLLCRSRKLNRGLDYHAASLRASQRRRWPGLRFVRDHEQVLRFFCFRMVISYI